VQALLAVGAAQNESQALAVGRKSHHPSGDPRQPLIGGHGVMAAVRKTFLQTERHARMITTCAQSSDRQIQQAGGTGLNLLSWEYGKTLPNGLESYPPLAVPMLSEEGAVPREHLVQHGAKTEHIRTLVERLPLGLFRGHVSSGHQDGAFDGLGGVGIRFRHQLGQPEIEQLGRALAKALRVAAI